MTKTTTKRPQNVNSNDSHINYDYANGIDNAKHVHRTYKCDSHVAYDGKTVEIDKAENDQQLP